MLIASQVVVKSLAVAGDGTLAYIDASGKRPAADLDAGWSSDLSLLGARVRPVST